MKNRRPKKEIEVRIEDMKFPGIGVGYYNDREVNVKGAFPKQLIHGRYMKNKQSIGQINLLEVLEKAPYEVEAKCPHFNECGGCISQMVPYDLEVKFKEKQVLDLLKENGIELKEYLGIVPSMERYGYRNKMEYTFGDEVKDGPLTLGMHCKYKRNSILTVDECKLVPQDFNTISKATLDYFKNTNIPYYRVMKREGTLRSLIIREGKNTKEIMVILVTRTDSRVNVEEYKNMLLNLKLKNEIKSIFYVENNSFQDAVVPEVVHHIYGNEYIEEEILGLKFKITPFSFFQTNTDACERLYSKVRELAGDTSSKDVFDLYCGTGTIGNIMASNSKSVTGVEIIKEAADIANENAKNNGFTNTEFIAGDVKDVIANLEKNPDLIILDPPRSGIHPKALEYAMKFKAKEIIYVSCNPKTMVEDLKKMSNTMTLEKFIILENYPNTSHVETVALLKKLTI